MNNIKEKINVLSVIGKEFNKENITWALGGSTLLYFKGITFNFDDIDIEVKEEDIIKAKSILLSLGKLIVNKEDANFETKHFYEFNINGVDIDLISGFIIVTDKDKHYFPLTKEDIFEYVNVNNVEIPLQSISKWREYYLLMNRLDKVELIDSKI